MVEKKLIDLYPYRIVNDKVEYLILKRAEDQRYFGQWRMVAGKVEENEKFWEAAIRELEEETGLVPKKLWTIPSINQFYEHRTDQILSIPAFAAEIEPSATVRLNREHSDVKWCPIGEVVDHIFWPEQKRLLKLLDTILNSNQIIEDWLIDIS